MIAKLLIIGAGGFLGAILRYGIGGLVQQSSSLRFPIGIMVVNVLGCFLFGLASGWFAGHESPSAHWKAFLTIGLLGGFTTFSTFGADTFDLLKSGQIGFAVLNAGLSVVLGILAVWGGISLVKG